MISVIFFAIVVVFLIVNSIVIVQQQTIGVIQRLGRFERFAEPGLSFKIPIIDSVVGRPSLRVCSLVVDVETKTDDDVFVDVRVDVQYFIIQSKIYDAFYRLSSPTHQIQSYVFDVIRAEVPKLKLDDVFAKKESLADAVKEHLTHVMGDFGYGIVKTLVTDIDPDNEVKKSMNAINAAQRHRMAATETGEADRILRVKAAEAEAQSKELQGKGIAAQRTAIVNGLRDSVDGFSHAIPGTDPMEVLTMILLTQYFDTLKDIGSNSNTNTILLPNNPGGMNGIMEELRNTFIAANSINTVKDSAIKEVSGSRKNKE